MRTYFLKLLRSLVIVHTVLVLAIYASDRNTVFVHFADTSMVSDTIIRLGDIAQITGAPSAQCTSLKNIVIGDAAPAGYARFVQPEDIVSRTIQPFVKGCAVRSNEPKRVVVKTGAITLTVANFSDSINAYLSKTLVWKTGEWQAVIKNPLDSWKLLPLGYTVTVSGLTSGNVRSHRLQAVLAQSCTRFRRGLEAR